MVVELEVGLSLQDLATLSALESSVSSPDDLAVLSVEERKIKALELVASDDAIQRLSGLYLEGKLSSMYPFMLAVSRKVLVERDINHHTTIIYIADMLTIFSRQENIEKVVIPNLEAIELEHPLDIMILAENARLSGNKQYAFYAYQRVGQISLFIAGIFPAHIYHKLEHRGVKTMSDYEEIGAANFRRALSVGYARHSGIERLADLQGFSGVRRALNDASRIYFQLREPFKMTLARLMGDH